MTFYNPLLAQNTISMFYTLKPESRLWIDGSSTINRFTFVTNQMEGRAYEGGDSKDSDQSRPWVFVSIPVRSLDGGNERMNDDMYEAMKADNYPHIQYELIAGEAIDKPDSGGGWFRLGTRGSLSIAGVRDTIDMIVRVSQLQGGSCRIKGSKSLSMLDFGITPPRAFFGLIEAHDRLVIRFDLVASRATKDSVDTGAGVRK